MTLHMGRDGISVDHTHCPDASQSGQSPLETHRLLRHCRGAHLVPFILWAIGANEKDENAVMPAILPFAAAQTAAE